jgi:hypothetical protein
MPRFTDRAPLWVYVRQNATRYAEQGLPQEGTLVISPSAARVGVESGGSQGGSPGINIWEWIDAALDASQRREPYQPLYIPPGFEVYYPGIDALVRELQDYGWVTGNTVLVGNRVVPVSTIRPTAAAFRPAVGQFSMFAESGVPGTALVPAPEGAAPVIEETCSNCGEELDACLCAVCPNCNFRVDELCDNCGNCVDGVSPCCECVMCGARYDGHRVGAGTLCENCTYCVGEDDGAADHCSCSYCEQCNSRVDAICEECNGCDSCCSCNTCTYGERRRVSDHKHHVNTDQNPEEWCTSCDRCTACCEYVGDCFTCDDCNERQGHDNRCSLEEHEDNYHCTRCCPGVDEEEEEEEEAFSVGEEIGYGLLPQLPVGSVILANGVPYVKVVEGAAFNTHSKTWRRTNFPNDDLVSPHDLLTTAESFGDATVVTITSLPGVSASFSTGGPPATPSGLPKWGPELAALAERAVMRSTCDLHDGKRCAGGVPFRSERSHVLRFINSTTFKRNPSHRHLGCEIESDHGGQPNGFVQKIIQKWDMAVHNDPSVRGREIITLPTNGDTFIEQIEELCSAFVTDGVVVTKFGGDGTGYHLHVDARDLSWSDLKRMFTLWAHVEGAALDALRPERARGLVDFANRREDEGAEGAILDPRRRTGGEEGSEEHEAEAKKAVIAALNRPRGAKAKKADLTPEGRLRAGIKAERRTLATSPSGDWQAARFPSERYYALNGMSLFRYGTIEIRAFEGTSNAEDIVCWGMLWAAFTDMTKGMSRKKMLQIIQQNPRSVLLDAAPNARTKLWLKRRWKLYAPEGVEGVKGRKGLRPVKKAATGEVSVTHPALGGEIDELSVLTSLPVGAIVEDRYYRRAQRYLDDAGLPVWGGSDVGEDISSADLISLGAVQTLIAFEGNPDFLPLPVVGQRVTARQLTELPMGAVVRNGSENYVKVVDPATVDLDTDERIHQDEWRLIRSPNITFSAQEISTGSIVVSFPRAAPTPAPGAPPSLRGELRRPWRR